MFHEYAAYLVRVKDGDTFEMMIDLGFACFTKQSIRTLTFSAPELRTPKGPAYRDTAHKILSEAKVITLQTYKDQRTFERWLAQVTVDGLPYSQAMSDHGCPTEGITPLEALERRGLTLADLDQ
jgi:hypothetical protein